MLFWVESSLLVWVRSLPDSIMWSDFRRSSICLSRICSIRSSMLPSCFPLSIQEGHGRSEEHTSELQSLMRISYAVFCLKKTKHMSYNIHIAVLIHHDKHEIHN